MRLLGTAMKVCLMGAMLAPRVAAARDEPKPVALYALLDTSASDPRLARAVNDVEKSCWYSEYSRSGPRLKDVTKCNAAEKKLLSFGTIAAQAALAATDHATVSASQRTRFYDVASRSGDISTVRAMVAALERLKRMSKEVIITSDRNGEGQLIEGALQRITFASIGERASWDDGANWNEVPQYAPWQAWLTAHETSAPAAWLAERIAESRAHANDHDVRTAFVAARFLALQSTTQKEGVVALKALAARKAASEEMKNAIEEVIANLPEVPTEKAIGDLRS